MRKLKIEITPKDFLELYDRITEMRHANSTQIADEVYATLQRYMSMEDMSTLNQYAGAYREFDDMAEIIEVLED